MLTTLMFTLELKFILKIESNALESLDCALFCCKARSFSDEVDVLMSSGGMDEYQLVSDKHLY